MTITPNDARIMAESIIGNMHPRWEHVQGVGRQAERLCEQFRLPPHIATAAWLHDVGYSPHLASTGFHPLDGARFLARAGLPSEVVRLVTWHTGAGFEAAERGLLAQLQEFAEPDSADLDVLTMIDLATSPQGEPVQDVVRIAEILARYEEGHPVHAAVTLSKPFLLASSRRAKERMGLPEDWPRSIGST